MYLCIYPNAISHSNLESIPLGIPILSPWAGHRGLTQHVLIMGVSPTELSMANLEGSRETFAGEVEGDGVHPLSGTYISNYLTKRVSH